MRQYCKVTADGLHHLFLGLDFGSVCVCGRTVYAFAIDTEVPTLCRVVREPPLPWETRGAEEKSGTRASCCSRLANVVGSMRRLGYELRLTEYGKGTGGRPST